MQDAENRLKTYTINPLSIVLLMLFKYLFFSPQPKSYQRTAIYWVMSAKQEPTRQKRLNELILDSENRLKIKPLR